MNIDKPITYPPIYVTSFGGDVANNTVLSFENITYEDLSFTFTSMLDIDLGTMGDLQIDGFTIKNVELSDVRGFSIQSARDVSIYNILIDGVTLNHYMLIQINSENIEVINATMQNLQGETMLNHVSDFMYNSSSMFDMIMLKNNSIQYNEAFFYFHSMMQSTLSIKNSIIEDIYISPTASIIQTSSVYTAMIDTFV